MNDQTRCASFGVGTRHHPRRAQAAARSCAAELRSICCFALLVLEMGQGLLFPGGAARGEEPPGAAWTELRIDAESDTGVVRPLHGVNGGPLNFGGLVDLSADWRAAGIPITRLHDCHWPNPDVVDIHAIFPNFDADPTAAASYDFRRTDAFVQSIIDTGAQIVFRLGESIEHTPTKYHVHPPPDVERWGAICAGIVRHYNAGWANGFHHGIRYWEIWNEPENRPQMWTGTDAEFLELYAATARRLKAEFPEMRVGGPGFGHLGELDGETFEPSPFFLRFLECCRDGRVPLDFLSWHCYTDEPGRLERLARAVRHVLNDHGFTTSESHLNEWNYLPGNDWSALDRRTSGAQREAFYARMGGPEGAAFAVRVLIGLQDAPVDVANFYSGDNQPFGLFTQHGMPRTNYHAFRAFHALTGARRLAVRGEGIGTVGVLAGKIGKGHEIRVLLAGPNQGTDGFQLVFENLDWPARPRFEIQRVDQANGLQIVETGVQGEGPVTLGVPVTENSVVLVRVWSGQPE